MCRVTEISWQTVPHRWSCVRQRILVLSLDLKVCVVQFLLNIVDAIVRVLCRVLQSLLHQTEPDLLLT